MNRFGSSKTRKKNEKKLPKVIETQEGEYGVTICDDCEKIVRDRYFFRSLCNLGIDLYADASVMALAGEAISLMDDKHKASHGRAPDNAGRMLVIRHYFVNIELPVRKSKPAHEIERLREHGILHRHSWGRWMPVAEENQPEPTNG